MLLMPTIDAVYQQILETTIPNLAHPAAARCLAPCGPTGEREPIGTRPDSIRAPTRDSLGHVERAEDDGRDALTRVNGIPDEVEVLEGGDGG